MPDPVRLPLADAARMLGTTPDTLRKKIKRGHLQATRDNTGRLMVWIEPPTESGQESSRPAVVQTGQVDSLASQESSLVQSLREHIETLKAQLDHERAERAEERTRLRAAMDREHDQATQADARVHNMADHLDRLRRDYALDQAERRIAEAEIERLSAELERARRPWWRRLFSRWSMAPDWIDRLLADPDAPMDMIMPVVYSEGLDGVGSGYV
jgi:septal ring factor EnvC (AmiA/AmiB activator)